MDHDEGSKEERQHVTFHPRSREGSHWVLPTQTHPTIFQKKSKASQTQTYLTPKFKSTKEFHPTPTLASLSPAVAIQVSSKWWGYTLFCPIPGGRMWPSSSWTSVKIREMPSSARQTKRIWHLTLTAIFKVLKLDQLQTLPCSTADQTFCLLNEAKCRRSVSFPRPCPWKKCQEADMQANRQTPHPRPVTYRLGWGVHSFGNPDGVPRIYLTSALKEHGQLPLQPKYTQLFVAVKLGNTA